MVNSDDLTQILGERPFRSAELRNIDKFRDGFQKKIGVFTPHDALVTHPMTRLNAFV